MKKLSALGLALLLSACGGSSGGDSPSPGTPVPPVNPPTPAPVVADTFYTRVMELIGIATDDADAATVEDVVLTSPEDTEPETPA